MFKIIIFLAALATSILTSSNILNNILKTGVITDDWINSTRNWTTYHNKQYGFQIRYNNDFVINTKFKGLVDSDKRVVELTLINNEYYHKTNLESAGLYIIVDERAQGVKSSCLKPLEDIGVLLSTKEMVINRTTFIVFETEEGAMSHTYKKNIYNTVHNNKCYKIVLFVSATAVGVFDPETIVQFKEVEVLEKLHEVISTFQFIN